MLCLHAGVDWDWEMPALFVWLFGAGGRGAGGAPARLGELGRTPRIAAALAVLVVAITPALIGLLAAPLDPRADAFAVRDCRDGDRRGADRDRALGMRPEPWRVLGYCDARLGHTRSPPGR